MLRVAARQGRRRSHASAPLAPPLQHRTPGHSGSATPRTAPPRDAAAPTRATRRRRYGLPRPPPGRGGVRPARPTRSWLDWPNRRNRRAAAGAWGTIADRARRVGARATAAYAAIAARH